MNWHHIKSAAKISLFIFLDTPGSLECDPSIYPLFIHAKRKFVMPSETTRGS